MNCYNKLRRNILSKSLKILKQVISIVLGVPILALGVVLIPLPGPGLLVSLLGLVILSYGFEKFKERRDKYFLILKDLYEQTKIKQKEYFDKIDKK